MNSMPRLMIAAPNSHAGKTTVTCAMLQALKLKNKKAVCFKCGPDYIDPMFHKRVLGTDGCNLDLYFTPEAVVKQLFCHYAQGQIWRLSRV